MTELVLYTNPRSRGRIARWMLEEVAVPYAVRILGYDGDMAAPAYRAINPMGKVPAIVHDRRVVTEAAAICCYLAETFPESELGPRVEELADYYRAIFFAAGPVEAAIANHATGRDPTPEEGRMYGYGSFDLAIDTLEHLLSDRAHVCGGRFTAADVYVGSQIIWGLAFGTIPERPVFTAYRDRLAARPAYGRAERLDAADAATN